VSSNDIPMMIVQHPPLAINLVRRAIDHFRTPFYSDSAQRPKIMALRESRKKKKKTSLYQRPARTGSKYLERSY